VFDREINYLIDVITITLYPDRDHSVLKSDVIRTNPLPFHGPHDGRHDPNDEEAPRLIKKEGDLSKLEKMVLKVPNTINNLPVLFGHPKNGHPSKYDYVWKAISSQHGNKRIPAGPICMREDVIGRNLTFPQQETAATKARVVIPVLGHRILYNFLRQAKTNIYPDGQNPSTYARTSTGTVDPSGTPWPSSCGGGGPSGLDVDSLLDIGHDNAGVAVALPAEVQVSDP